MARHCPPWAVGGFCSDPQRHTTEIKKNNKFFAEVTSPLDMIEAAKVRWLCDGGNICKQQVIKPIRSTATSIRRSGPAQTPSRYMSSFSNIVAATQRLCQLGSFLTYSSLLFLALGTNCGRQISLYAPNARCGLRGAATGKKIFLSVRLAQSSYGSCGNYTYVTRRERRERRRMAEDRYAHAVPHPHPAAEPWRSMADIAAKYASSSSPLSRAAYVWSPQVHLALATCPNDNSDHCHEHRLANYNKDRILDRCVHA